MPDPFGRGQQFASTISPLVDDLVGGWSISGVTWWRSGSPLEFSSGTQYLLGNNSGQRANFSCPVDEYNPHKVDDWFDTSCFSQPIGFVFGNSGISAGNLYGPHYNDWDMSFSKAIHMTEHAQLQFQAQFFNVFNHVNFQPPNTNQSSGPGSFGYITSDFLPRVGQLGLTLSF